MSSLSENPHGDFPYLRREIPELKPRASTSNPCAKRVTREHAYAIYRTYDGETTYYVLKKYQSPSKEATNPYARWLVEAVTSQQQKGEGATDMYVSSLFECSVPIEDASIHSPPLWLCPSCQQKVTGYPAMSRKDNKTKICSTCGGKEAIETFEQAMKGERDLFQDHL